MKRVLIVGGLAALALVLIFTTALPYEDTITYRWMQFQTLIHRWKFVGFNPMTNRPFNATHYSVINITNSAVATNSGAAEAETNRSGER